MTATGAANAAAGGIATAGLSVLHLLDTDNFAGTERYLLLLMQGLRGSGASVHLACRSDGVLFRKADEAGFEPWPAWGASHGVYAGYRALRRMLADRPVDLLHAHNGRTSLVAALLSRATGIPAVATQHFIEPQSSTYRGPKRWLASAAHRWVNASLAHVLCVSAQARTAMLRRENASPERLTTVHNGIEPLSDISPSRRAEIRRLLGIGPDTQMVLTVARLEREKGIEYLLAAMPELLRSGGDTWLVVVGDGALRGELAAAADRLSVSRRVIFTGFRSDAADLIACCDVFVLPSPAEPFGLVLLEAMSLAKPVVACDAGGPSEIVSTSPPQTGLLVPPRDPNALARAIAGLLSDPAAREAMGRAGAERFRSLFTVERMVDQTLAIYGRVVREHPTPIRCDTCT